MKKSKALLLIISILCIFFVRNVTAYSDNSKLSSIKVVPISGGVPNTITGSICDEDGVKRAFLILGTIKDVIKIMIPAVLIIIGSITIFKTVTYGDDSEIKNAMMDLGKKVIISLLIFFVPDIIEAMVSLVGSKYDSVKSGFIVCWDCFSGGSCNINRVNGPSSS